MLLPPSARQASLQFLEQWRLLDWSQTYPAATMYGIGIFCINWAIIFYSWTLLDQQRVNPAIRWRLLGPENPLKFIKQESVVSSQHCYVIQRCRNARWWMVSIIVAACSFHLCLTRTCISSLCITVTFRGSHAASHLFLCIWLTTQVQVVEHKYVGLRLYMSGSHSQRTQCSLFEWTMHNTS